MDIQKKNEKKEIKSIWSNLNANSSSNVLVTITRPSSRINTSPVYSYQEKNPEMA